MSMTESVGLVLGLGSMSLPRRRRPGSSSSGEKMLLPLLVLGLWSVGLKLMGERKPWPCVRRARGNVLRPVVWKKKIKLYRHTHGPTDKLSLSKCLLDIYALLKQLIMCCSSKVS